MSSKEMEENRVFMRLSEEASNATRFINLKYGMNGFGLHQHSIHVFTAVDEDKHTIIGILNIDGTLSIEKMFGDECLCKINILDSEAIFEIYKYDYLHCVHREEQIPQAIKDSGIYLFTPYIRKWVQRIYDEYGFKEKR